MCWWLSRSASSAPYASTRLHSWLIGRSTDVDTFSPGAVCPSIRLRMDSTAACERRKRSASASCSRSSSSSECSVSIKGLPNWLASYRPKKMVRRAFSVSVRDALLPLVHRSRDSE